jgi:prenyltransferase beta subunit
MSASPRARVTKLVILGTLAAALLPATTATATPPWTANQGQLDKTVGYMRGAQNADGGFGGAAGQPSDPLFSAWVVMALAAAGINPKDQRVVGGTDAYTYVTANAAALSDTTDFERAMLVAVASGTSPRDFGGRDLVAAILTRRLPDGSFTHAAGGSSGGINDTAFAILPLSATDEPAKTDIISRAAAWLVGVQRQDGGWSWAPGREESSDMTAAVIQALRIAPPTAKRAEAQRRGWSYLRSTQREDGGFGQTPIDPESNSASTAWALQAMWASAIDPTTWRRADGTPLDYLASLQQPDGSIKYKKGRSLNDLWMTAYAAPALAGYPLPVPSIARTTGKGGKGAALYSRPQPDSTGSASGGVRQISSSSAETKTRRRGGAKRVATGTAQSNGIAVSGVTPIASETKDTKKTGGRTSREPAKAEPRRPGARAGEDAREAVTGRLLASAAPAGVSGTGTRTAAAPGLRAPRTDRDDDPSATTALALTTLLLLAALAGAALEAHHGRKGLLP